MDKAEAFRRQLEQLSADYRAELPAKLAELDALWTRLAGGATDAAGCRQLLRELHTLAGSAKTFGVAGVSSAARTAELFLEPHCEKGALAEAADRQHLDGLLDELRRAARA